jgi:hypothetical protein
MMFAPLEGWRRVTVTDRHTAIDYAHVLREISDTHCPNAAKIVLVQDNLNTHKPASLYEAFPAPEARRLAERFEWQHHAKANWQFTTVCCGVPPCGPRAPDRDYTSRHGSWLDLAESELGVLLRWSCHAVTSRARICLSAMRRARHCEASTPARPWRPPGGLWESAGAPLAGQGLCRSAARAAPDLPCGRPVAPQ